MGSDGPALKEVYPLWLRLWHWTNATLFLALLVTGISLHFASPRAPLIPFNTARLVHNVGGILLTANYLLFLVMSVISGNWVHYVPRPRGLLKRLWVQALFYGGGIFQGKPHPYPPTVREKFNPLQQLTYGGVMLGMMPILIVSGLLFLFPEYAPERILGFGGIWPVAVIHYLAALFLTVFMVGHIYLGTCGETPTAEFHKMLHGEQLPADGSPPPGHGGDPADAPGGSHDEAADTPPAQGDAS